MTAANGLAGWRLVRGQLRLPVAGVAAAAGLVAGVLLIDAVPVLPSPAACWLLCAGGLAGAFLRRMPLSLAAAVLGCGIGALHAHRALDARLPAALEGRDLAVTGFIEGLPEARAGMTRFEFEVQSARLGNQDVAFRGHVRLGWYETPPPLAPCARWALTLRLKRPHGLVNPGGFDFERYAAEARLLAVGYVRGSARRLPPATPESPCIDGWRLALSEAMAARLAPGPVTAVLQGLAVGDQRALDEADWQVLRATGISHLIAISGLHVGLFAAFGALLVRALWKLCARVTLRVPAPLIEAPAALACAVAYGALAGFGVPTLRTLLMIATALIARHARRGQSVAHALALAATVMVLVDPLALLAPGFWLSFGGVAALLLIATPGSTRQPWWRELPRVQLAISLALLPLTVWFFGQASMVGPVANLVAVPWISFVVVPLVVAGSLLLPLLPGLATPVLVLAWHVLAPLWAFLSALAALPLAQSWFPAAAPWALGMAVVGVAWCLLPRGVPARWAGALLVLPMLVPATIALRPGQFEVLLLDVGQGLSVLVRTAHHAVLYDAGARYPSGFDLGEAVVVPTLHALGIGRLDRLIVSHGDNDHAGGAPAVERALLPRYSETGEPERVPSIAHRCQAGEAWTWDAVGFRIVSPPAERPVADNDRSCVLVVSATTGTAILPGDVSTRIEERLPAALAPVTHPLLLIVAHHGSATSSSASFLDALGPDLALVSAGYRNRFGHPRPGIVQRYVERGITLFGTAPEGALAVRFDGGVPTAARERRLRDAWWREHP
jgi:competence protein ComEC